MKIHQVLEVDFKKRITIHHEKFRDVLEIALGPFHRSSRTKCLLFPGVLNGDVPSLTIAEGFLDLLGKITGAQYQTANSLKAELSKVESLQFIFTAPTFVPMEVTDRLRKERREFFIPKTMRERGLYGTEFEIQLRNKLTQRAIA